MEPETDPVGPATGSYRVARGGNSSGPAPHCRSARRQYQLPGYAYVNFGLRVVMGDIDIAPTPTNTAVPTPTSTPTRTYTAVPSPTSTPLPTYTPTQIGTPVPELVVPLDLPTEGLPLEMVLIPPGTFTIGSPEDEEGRFSDEGPRHTVTITEPFYIGRYEVTQAQWQAVMGELQPVILYFRPEPSG